MAALFRIDRLFTIRKHLDDKWSLYVGSVPRETLQYICYKEYCNVLKEDDLLALESKTSAEDQAVLSRFVNWITSSDHDTVMHQGEDAALSQEMSTWVGPAFSGPSYEWPHNLLARPRRANMIMGGYQFPHIHFDVTISRGAYTPSLGRLDHSKPHTSGFGDGEMSTKASLLVWDASLSNLSGSAWFINRTEGNLVDPWAMLTEIRACKTQQPIPTSAQLDAVRRLLWGFPRPRRDLEADAEDGENGDILTNSDVEDDGNILTDGNIIPKFTNTKNDTEDEERSTYWARAKPAEQFYG